MPDKIRIGPTYKPIADGSNVLHRGGIDGVMDRLDGRRIISETGIQSERPGPSRWPHHAQLPRDCRRLCLRQRSKKTCLRGFAGGRWKALAPAAMNEQWLGGGVPRTWS